MENYEYVLLISKTIKVFTLKSIAIILKTYDTYYKSMELTLIKPMVSIYLISHYLSLYHSNAHGNHDNIYIIRKVVERKVVALEYILAERQNADIFTKPLDRSKFESLRQVIGVIICP